MRMASELTDNTMTSPEFKKIMKEEKFDLVIIGVFMNDYLLGIGDHFQCPTMMLSVAGAFIQTNLLVGNPLSVNAVPNIFGEQVKSMTFVDRLKNLGLYGIEVTMQILSQYSSSKTYE